MPDKPKPAAKPALPKADGGAGAPPSGKGDPHARIDAIVAVLEANGISLPASLAPKKKAKADTEKAADE